MLRRALLVLALLVVACAPDRTAILVEVTSSDLAVPDDVDGLRFEAVSELGGRVDRSFPIASTWPQSLTIVPPEGERTGRVTISVTGTHGGGFVVRRVVEAAFQSGTTITVRVDLTSACRGVMCADGVDCRGGACVGVEGDGGVDGGGVDGGGVDGGGVDDAGTDAQVTPDDAGTDGGSDASIPPDATISVDGGRDAGIDGGAQDAGVDGGSRSDAGARPSTLLITEIDYDQPGSDNAEFVEIRNVSSSTIDLTSHTLYLVNGSSVPATTYASVPLTGTLAPGDLLVVGPSTLSIPVTARLQVFSMAIQNGDPDGVALWNGATGALVDALSYGGAITVATIAATSVSLVEGTATTARDSTTAVRSLCRFPDTADSGDDSVDWVTCATPTPGAANAR